MRSALVTGATGFVGSHLVDLLLERGHRVTCTLRKTSQLRWLEGKPIERLEVDFRKPLSLPEVDVVFHVAGVIMGDSLEQYREGNVVAARNTIVGARCGRFVHVSTIAASGPGEVDETTECAPISHYGRSKLEGEKTVREHRNGIPLTIIRPPVVYGERDLGLLDMFRLLNRGLCPKIGGEKWISIVHARDLVEGMVRAAETPAAENETYFLSNRRVHTISGLTDHILSGFGRKWSVPIPVPDRVVRFMAGVAENWGRLSGKPGMFNRDKAKEMTQERWVCSPEKAQKELGWTSRIPIGEGIARTGRWYRENGFL